MTTYNADHTIAHYTSSATAARGEARAARDTADSLSMAVGSAEAIENDNPGWRMIYPSEAAAIRDMAAAARRHAESLESSALQDDKSALAIIQERIAYQENGQLAEITTLLEGNPWLPRPAVLPQEAEQRGTAPSWRPR